MNGSRTSRPIIALLAMLGLAGLMLTMILMFGRVSGEEFSAKRFALRSFSYRRIPLTQLQVWPITYQTINNDLTSHLNSKQLVGDPNSIDSRWDVVHMTAIEDTVGDAQLLTSYLRGPAQNRWLSWSRSKPALAQELWPVVATLARHRAYIFVPQLMELAESASDATALRQDIRQYLQLHVAKIVQASIQDGRHASAAEMCEAAISLDLETAQFSQWKQQAKAASNAGS